MSGGLSAGAASVSISPRLEDLREGVWLGGFGSYRQRRATGVLDEPQCRAVVVSDGGSAFAVAALDLVGASGPLLSAIRKDAAKRIGVPAESILIACTHSHASPDLQGLWGGVPDGYRKYIAQNAAQAIWLAYKQLAPARATASTTALGGGLVVNRRGWPETDETLTTMRLTSPEGMGIATIVNYACHPTAIGSADTRVSRDWCGFATDAIEREAGGVAIYINGAIGDVNPSQSGGEDAARSLGEAVASAALTSMRDAEDIGGAFVLNMHALEVPMHFEGLSQRVQDAVARAGFALHILSTSGGLGAASAALHTAGRSDLAQIVAALRGMSERHIIRRETGTYIASHCGHFAIGDGFEALVAPGEVLTRLALPLRASMGARHRMFFGLTQDTLGYFVPADEWMTGRNNNYEESVSPGRHAGMALADALLQLIPHRGEFAS